MKITDVRINNWQAPGPEWWDAVARQPDEPLIEATISFTLSHREYQELIDRQEKAGLRTETLPPDGALCAAPATQK